MKYDVLLVAHKKDYIKLNYVIKYIKKNLIGYNNIHLIVKNINDVPKFVDVLIHNEQDVLPVDFNKFKYRPTWIYQQMIKLLQNVTFKNYIVVDSDTIINKPLNPFDQNNKPVFFFTKNQYHEKYFKYLLKYFNINKCCNYSFISEIMFFNREIIKKMFFEIKLVDIKDIINFFYDSNTEDSYISEFELYGNYMESKFKGVYTYKHLSIYDEGSESPSYWSEEKIHNNITNNDTVDIITMHSWL